MANTRIERFSGDFTLGAAPAFQEFQIGLGTFIPAYGTAVHIQVRLVGQKTGGTQSMGGAFWTAGLFTVEPTGMVQIGTTQNVHAALLHADLATTTLELDFGGSWIYGLLTHGTTTGTYHWYWVADLIIIEAVA